MALQTSATATRQVLDDVTFDRVLDFLRLEDGYGMTPDVEVARVLASGAALTIYSATGARCVAGGDPRAVLALCYLTADAYEHREDTSERKSALTSPTVLGLLEQMKHDPWTPALVTLDGLTAFHVERVEEG